LVPQRYKGPGTTGHSSDSPRLIWRTEIEAYFPDSQYRYLYAGMANRPGWQTSATKRNAGKQEDALPLAVVDG
jgi:hypothetical protein